MPFWVYSRRFVSGCKVLNFYKVSKDKMIFWGRGLAVPPPASLSQTPQKTYLLPDKLSFLTLLTNFDVLPGVSTRQFYFVLRWKHLTAH